MTLSGSGWLAKDLSSEVEKISPCLKVVGVENDLIQVTGQQGGAGGSG